MKLLLICGKAESGKDTFGNILKEEFEAHKQKTCILKITAPLYNYAKNYFDWDGTEENKPRSLLQTLGIEVIKEQLGMDTFLLDRLKQDIMILDNYYDVGIITDGRLINEIEYLKKNFKDVKVIRLFSDRENDLSAKEKSHITEKDLDNSYEYDYVIHNKSLDELKEEAKNIYNWEKTIEIAIDGPCAVGKSVTALAISKKLNFVYVDTGAMYRAIGLYMKNNNINIYDEDKVVSVLDLINIDLKYKDGVQLVYLNDKDVSGEIRTNEISKYASVISQYAEVRSKLVDMQRDIAYKTDVVMDGRDIGTVVLPNADLKIYLTADIEERAKRRKLEYELKGESFNLEEVKKELEERDYRDTNRENSPLKKAHDAVVVDTTNYSIDEVRDIIIKLLDEKRK